MTTTTDERTVLTVVPSAVFCHINVAKAKKTKVHRWVNLAQIKTVTYIEETGEIQLHPAQGIAIRITDPESVAEIKRAIASYSVHP